MTGLLIFLSILATIALILATGKYDYEKKIKEEKISK
jgi:hypothetical protein